MTRAYEILGSIARASVRNSDSGSQWSNEIAPISQERIAPVGQDAVAVDEHWYMSEYPDVAESGMTARQHYETYGRNEGRLPRALQRELKPVQLQWSTADHRRRVIFISGEPLTPGHGYRVENIARVLTPTENSVHVVSADDFLGDDLLLSTSFDLVWIWRTPWSRALQVFVDSVKERGGKCIFDIDDLMFDASLADGDVIDGIRSLGYARDAVANLFEGLGRSALLGDVCVAPTRPLAEALRGLGTRVAVIPNGYSDEWLRAAEDARRARGGATDSNVFRVGYASGSLTHQRDLAVASPAVARFLESNPTARLVLFRGTVNIHEFPELGNVVDQVEWRDLVPHVELAREYARFDVNIAPLEVGNPFCESKSALKFHEAALVGVPTIASPTIPYLDAVTDGIDGLLASSTGGWFSALQALAQDVDLRRALGASARESALRRFGPTTRRLCVDQLLGMVGSSDYPDWVHVGNPADFLPPGRPELPSRSDVVLEERSGRTGMLTIVVAIRDGATGVTQILESVGCGWPASLDVILITAGPVSTETREELLSLQHMFTSLSLHQVPAESVPAQMCNLGASLASSPWILAVVADGNSQLIEGNLPSVWSMVKHVLDAGLDAVHPEVIETDRGPAAMLLRRDALQLMGGFCERDGRLGLSDPLLPASTLPVHGCTSDLGIQDVQSTGVAGYPQAECGDAPVSSSAAPARNTPIAPRDAVASDDAGGAHRTQGTVHGFVDLPRLNDVVRGNLLYVSGWCAFEHGPVRRVEARLDGEYVGTARLGLPRPDVYEATGWEFGFASGFEFRLPVTVGAGQRKRVRLRLTVVDDAGQEFDFAEFEVDVARSKPSDVATQATTRPADHVDVLVFTHSLALGGGQLYVQELVRQLATADQLQLSVVSPQDGVLREELVNFGVSVHISAPVNPGSVAAYEGRVREWGLLCAETRPELVVVNTLGMFGAVDAAKRMGIPVVWAIHESFSIPDFCFLNWGADGVPPEVEERIYWCLGNADKVVFESEATRQLYGDLVSDNSGEVIRYGIDTREIRGFRKSVNRDALRTRTGIPNDALVMLSMGVFEPRKGQLLVLSAFFEVARVRPELHLVLVGAHDSPYSQSVRDYVMHSGMERRVTVVEITPEIDEWYAVSDVLVSAADIESLPRSMLEAMAHGLPVLSADVFGVSELVRDGVEGLLFRPSDRKDLVDAIRRYVEVPPSQRQRMGQAAQRRIWNDFDSRGYASAFAGMVDSLTRR